MKRRSPRIPKRKRGKDRKMILIYKILQETKLKEKTSHPFPKQKI